MTQSWQANPFTNAHMDYEREKAAYERMHQINRMSAMQNQSLNRGIGLGQLNYGAEIQNQNTISQPEPNKVLLLLGDTE
jgi:hypothetical protein